MCASARDREALAAVQGPGPGRGAAVLAGRRVRASTRSAWPPPGPGLGSGAAVLAGPCTCARERTQCAGGRPGRGRGVRGGGACLTVLVLASARGALAAARA